ncbi:MAG TPA: tyrosinase family protein [Rhodanobacter sp.]|jgi:tyrosinase|nr:tyrosinase family protein [Rhodanobacter sp.]
MNLRLVVPVIRTNFLANETARKQYIAGVQLLKLSGRYDNYIRMHLAAMTFPVGASVGRINAAHMCAAFLPWHRALLHAFESDLQRVLNNTNFGLPYWDWSADAVLADPTKSAIWGAGTTDCMGGSGNPITTGPFVNWHTIDARGNVSTAGISRNLGAFGDLPSYASIAEIIGRLPYDVSPYSTYSKTGFRNALEGYSNTSSSQMHNEVHGWVGGLMGIVQVSPNDPVFFLHHANVDRIWAMWQSQNSGQTYVPVTGGVPTQQLNDVMAGYPISPTNIAYTPAIVWNIQNLGYSYDVFPLS